MRTKYTYTQLYNNLLFDVKWNIQLQYLVCVHVNKFGRHCNTQPNKVKISDK
jgi:hypothetical protein